MLEKIKELLKKTDTAETEVKNLNQDAIREKKSLASKVKEIANKEITSRQTDAKIGIGLLTVASLPMLTGAVEASSNYSEEARQISIQDVYDKGEFYKDMSPEASKINTVIDNIEDSHGTDLEKFNETGEDFTLYGQKNELDLEIKKQFPNDHEELEYERNNPLPEKPYINGEPNPKFWGGADSNPYRR